MSAAEPTAPSLAALRRARARREATLRRARWVSPAVVVVLLILASRSTPGPGLHGDSLGVLIAMCGLAAGALGALGALRARPSSSAVLAVCYAPLFLGSAGLLWLQPSGPGLFGLMLALILTTRLVRGRLGAAVAAGAFAILLVADVAGGHGHRSLSSVLLSVVALAAAYTVALFSRRLREGADQTEQLLIEAATLAERQRLAREMHDVLAHSLSGLTVQLEGARLLATQDPADPRLATTIELAHHLAKSGLDEARRAISVLRDEELPGPERLSALVAQFEHDSGISCRFAVVGDRRDLDAQTRLAMYRVTQEALTNVRKHAQPERVEVRLGYVPRGARLVIEDFGGQDGRSPLQADAGQPVPSADTAALRGNGWAGRAGGGYGLNGMRERAELLGGTLTAAATESGFRVELEVPA
ncbi:MAG TPA: sensor histidine kinase [Streptosporangiaceae bacterium]